MFLTPDTVALVGFYLDEDGDPIEYDDTPDDDSMDLQPDFWRGPPDGGPVRPMAAHPAGGCDDDACPRCGRPVPGPS